MRLTFRTILCAGVLTLAAACGLSADDWPTYRHDVRRTGVTQEELPAELHLQWVRELPAPEPAWPDQPRLRFDVAYEPIIAEGKVFIASARSSSVTAYDAATGEEVWRFYANGPVRFAPTVAGGKVYFVADDGFLYCLSAADGRPAWSFNGAPAERWLLGNKRLISAWCARGAPVVADGKVCFAAGIWPMMGVFVYALDAETGKLVWSNDSLGSLFILQAHGAPAFSGLAPQGYLAVANDRLIVPGGRTVPTALDLRTGNLLYYHLKANGACGGFDVSVGDGFFCNNYMVFDLPSGQGGFLRNWYGMRTWPAPLVDGNRLTSLANYDPAIYTVQIGEGTDAKGNRIERLPTTAIGPRVKTGGFVHIKASRLLIGGGDKTLTAAILPDLPAKPKVVWTKAVEGNVAALAVANGRLYVSTREGKLYCYGGEKVEPKTLRNDIGVDVDRRQVAAALEMRAVSRATDGICLVLGARNPHFLEDVGVPGTLRVIAVDPDARACDAMRSALDYRGLLSADAVQVLCADPSSMRLPPYLADLVVSESGMKTPGEIAAAARALRPYGGTAVIALPLAEAQAAVRQLKLPGTTLKPAGNCTLLVREGPPPGAADWTHQNADPANTLVGGERNVKLPLGLLWFGGVANDATLPRHGHGPSPLVAGGRLFIEGPDSLSARDVYTGRVLWQRDFPGVGFAYDDAEHRPGANSLGSNYVAVSDSVYLVYKGRIQRLDPATGKTLAEFALPAAPGEADPPSLGYLAVVDDLLIAGAKPLAWDWDADFTAWQLRSVEDKDIPALAEAIAAWPGYPKVSRETATDAREFILANLNRVLDEPDVVATLPADLRATQEAHRIAGPRIKAAREKLDAYLEAKPSPPAGDRRLRELNREVLQSYYVGKLPFSARGRPGDYNCDYTASAQLVAMNRLTGAVLWSQTAKQSFRHNTICVGAGKVFTVDRLPKRVFETLRKWKEEPNDPPALVAFDLRTGRELWRKTDDVFGSWLSYAPAHDALVMSTRISRDMLYDEEERGFRVCKGADGSVLWQKEVRYEGPVILDGGLVVTQHSEGTYGSAAYDIRTGERMTFKHPLTGVDRNWYLFKSYACGTAAAAPGLLLFRSDAAGFHDLAGFGGTGNFGGFKSGCTANLIPADGVLSAPDYTRTCVCSYQNQASLALVHDPDVEVWTFNDYACGPARVRRVGINLGAPGDRRAEDGTLWLDWPSVGGPSPNPAVTSAPDDVEWYYRHSLRLAGDGLKWVAASGAKGLREMSVTLAEGAEDEKPYVVRLHFAECDGLAAGDRVFDVSLQGKPVLAAFDVASEAGGAHRAVVREFRGVLVRDVLKIALAPAAGSKNPRPILSGVEIVADGWPP